jgi:hypothetical protein
MVYFHTKNPNLGKFGTAWEWNFMTIWIISQPFGILYVKGIVCGHLVYLSHFGIFGPSKIWLSFFQCMQMLRAFSGKHNFSNLNYI